MHKYAQKIDTQWHQAHDRCIHAWSPWRGSRLGHESFLVAEEKKPKTCVEQEQVYHFIWAFKIVDWFHWLFNLYQWWVVIGRTTIDNDQPEIWVSAESLVLLIFIYRYLLQLPGLPPGLPPAASTAPEIGTPSMRHKQILNAWNIKLVQSTVENIFSDPEHHTFSCF